MQTLREPSPQAISVVNSVKLETRKYSEEIMKEGHLTHIRDKASQMDAKHNSCFQCDS